ncbi:MAG TPA: thiamine phosphate synthase [Polyangiaceae bacterium]|nr:thiamine phosphate synthase [Polyangiaceae bacterium]
MRGARTATDGARTARERRANGDGRRANGDGRCVVNVREQPPRLIALTDRSMATEEATLQRFERLARLARPFTVMFQLRDRELSARERLAFGRKLRALCTRERQWFQVNDRCDLARLLDADAVHLGEASLGAEDARRAVGADVFVTRACHDPECTLDTRVDGWVLSPIFAQRKGRAALGEAGIARLAARLRSDTAGASSVYALGGVNAGNARRAVAAGAAGVAVVGAILAEDDYEPLLGLELPP